MPRIQPIDPNQAQGKAAPLLEGVRKKLGRVPNIFATMAKSPAVLEAYLGFGRAMNSASLSGALREQIALTVAGANGCRYCASAHNAVAEMLGVAADERQVNLNAESGDAKTRAALHFARKIVENRGWVNDADVQAVRDAGYDDAAILEIIAATTINIFTNYFNHIVETEVDFPIVEVPAATT